MKRLLLALLFLGSAIALFLALRTRHGETPRARDRDAGPIAAVVSSAPSEPKPKKGAPRTPAAAPATASYVHCKPAWSRSAKALHALARDAQKGEEETLARQLDVLVGFADGDRRKGDASLTSDAGLAAACEPDDHGAWAILLRPEARPPAPNRRCGDIVVSVARIDLEGRIAATDASVLQESEGCATDANAYLSDLGNLTLAAISDMNGDGVPEALLSHHGDMTPGLHALFTSHGGAVGQYPGTVGLDIVDVRDENDDGRPDVVFQYTLDGGYEAGCGAPAQMVYTPPLVAFPRSDGLLDFNGPEGRAAARKACPVPPASAKDDLFCAKVWGFDARAIPNFTKLEAECVASYADEDAKMEEPGAGCGSPSRDACSHFSVLQMLREKKLPMALWPPPDSEAVTRSEAENAAILAAKEALRKARKAMAAKHFPEAIALYESASDSDDPDVVAGELAYARVLSGDAAGAASAISRIVDRVVDPRTRAADLYNLGLAEDALGDKPAALRAFVRAEAVRPTPEARAKLGAAKVCPVDAATANGTPISLAQWKQRAGAPRDSEDLFPPDGDWYTEQPTNDHDFVLMSASHYPSGLPTAFYGLDPKSGRVDRCLSARGCTCATGSPCIPAPRSLPPAARELAVFRADGSRLVARATWPSDADPNGEIRADIEGAGLTISGLGCATSVSLGH